MIQPSSLELLLRFISSEAREKLAYIRDLDDIIESAVRSAAETWPALTLPREQFLRYLAGHLPVDARDFGQALRKLRFTDLYLCCACVEEIPRSIETFQHHYRPLIRSKLRRLRLRDPLAADIEQQLLEQLLVGEENKAPMLTRFAGVGRLTSWLQVVTARTARRVLEKEKKLLPVDDGELCERVVDNEYINVELLDEKGQYRRAFKSAFKKALTTLAPRDANLLRQRYVDQLILKEIGRIYRVNSSTIHRRLNSIKDHLLQQTEIFLREELTMSVDDFDSILRLIRSDFDVTLRTFLNPAAKEESHTTMPQGSGEPG